MKLAAEINRIRRPWLVKGTSGHTSDPLVEPLGILVSVNGATVSPVCEIGGGGNGNIPAGGQLIEGVTILDEGGVVGAEVRGANHPRCGDAIPDARITQIPRFGLCVCVCVRVCVRICISICICICIRICICICIRIRIRICIRICVGVGIIVRV